MAWPQKLHCPSRRFLRAPAHISNEECRQIWRGFCAEMDRLEREWAALTDEQRAAYIDDND